MTTTQNTSNPETPLSQLLLEIREMLLSAEYADGIARCRTQDVEEVENAAEAVRQQQCLYGSAKELLAALRGCVFALDKNIEGPGPSPRAALEMANSAIARATGGVRRNQPHAITVQVHRGLITDVSGLPEGYELRVEDYDVDDTGDPRWNAKKECVISVYGEGEA
jgi:hypothetical protein